MKDAKWVYEFTLEDAQKAYNLLAMHHSELLNMNHNLQEQLRDSSELLNMNHNLQEQLRDRSVTNLLMWKIRRLFKKDWE